VAVQGSKVGVPPTVTRAQEFPHVELYREKRQ
jgi:hypothetical protein